MDVPLGHGPLVWVSLLFRLGGLVLVAPIFSAAVVPMRMKTAVTLILSVVLFPMADATRVADAALGATGLFTELVVGLIVGLGAAVFIGAAELAGDMMAVQTGLSGASIVDPLSRNQVPVLGQFLGLTALVLILAADGHLVMVRALHQSFVLVPVGSTAQVQAMGIDAIRLGSSLFLLGLRFAAPVIGALMVGHVALGVLARTVPQLNVLMMAFPLQIAVGLFVLAVTLPSMASAFTVWPESYSDLVAELLGRL